MVIQEQEESGWTSYLGCPSSSQQLPTPPHSSLTPQHPHLSSTTLFTLDNFQLVPHTTLNSHFLAAHLQHRHHHHHHEQATEHDGYCIGRAPSMDFPDDESCGSSTLSDANSSLGCSRPQQKHSFATRNQQSLKRKRRQCRNGKVAATTGGLPTDLLEDTATSLPYSDQASKCSRLDVSDDCNEEGDVSKRFKALQALIPCLKEMMHKENEEEMLNAIISHVRALEKKVQLLSDVWRLSQVNHE